MRRYLTIALVLCTGLTRADAPAQEDRPDAPDAPSLVSPPAAAQMPANVVLVETRMQRRALHRLNATSGIRLPRIQLYTADGRQVLHAIGWEDDVGERVRALVARGDAKAKSRTRLDDVVAELEESSTAAPLARDALPAADYYVVTGWAGWCRPCATAMVELRKVFEADPAHRYAWITIETDVVKQKLQKQTIR